MGGMVCVDWSGLPLRLPLEATTIPCPPPPGGKIRNLVASSDVIILTFGFLAFKATRNSIDINFVTYLNICVLV